MVFRTNSRSFSTQEDCAAACPCYPFLTKYEPLFFRAGVGVPGICIPCRWLINLYPSLNSLIKFLNKFLNGGA